MFDWREFLRLAERLGGEAAEASKRSAISRAYYAAFHQACQYLASRYPDVRVPETGEAHQVVWSFLEAPNRRRTEREAANKGSSLKRQRRNADYRDVVGALDSETAHALRLANRIVDLLAGNGRESAP